MPLQNRVTPRGEIVAVAARGSLMGNRGRLHDGERRLVRRHVAGYRAWVTCVLQFKGRRRTVMTPGRYTELFFFDEATALAAGHRPCGECRREDFLRFKRAWLAGNRQLGLPADVTIQPIDRHLHADRLDAHGQRTFVADSRTLPDGVLVASEDDPRAWLLWRDRLWPWSPAGYGEPRRVGRGRVVVLTPRSTVAALAAGYTPAVVMAPSRRRRRRGASSRRGTASVARRRRSFARRRRDSPRP
jgi:hypothetical protein